SGSHAKASIPDTRSHSVPVPLRSRGLWGAMMANSVRRADFLMLLAYATDLATGAERDFALRGCVLSMRLAKVAGFDVEGQRSVFHQALLRYAGCNADTHLLAAAFGDEIAMRQDLAYTDMGNHHQLVEVFVRAFNRLF